MRHPPFIYWFTADRAMVRRINRLTQDMRRDPLTGIGRTEPLRYQYAGAWSRRINDEHRLVYVPSEDEVMIIAARYHYDK